MTPWLAHLYTALGAGTALAATFATFAGEFRQAFLWLALAVFVDSTDGVLARALRVKERLPWFSGDTLDNLVDYLTYVFVPVLLMLRAELLPAAVGVVARRGRAGRQRLRLQPRRRQGADQRLLLHRLPVWYWNILAVYLFAWRLDPWTNAAIVAVLVGLVFVPLRYVYPTRTRTWRPATLLLGVIWALRDGDRHLASARRRRPMAAALPRLPRLLRRPVAVADGPRPRGGLAARGGSGGAAPRAAMRLDLHPNVHSPHVGDPECKARRLRISSNIRGRSNDASRGPHDAWWASWGGTQDAAPAECRHHLHHGLLAWTT